MTGGLSWDDRRYVADRSRASVGSAGSTGSAGAVGEPARAGRGNSARAASGSAAQVQRDIVEAAYSLVGRRSLVVGGERFSADCTGTVLAAYYAAGIDLRDHFSRFTGNGVTRLYKMGEHYNLMHAPRQPQPGDVIFWDNTYDRNRDGRFNDPLTHNGVVVEVKPNGQIEYVHYNYARGVVVEKLNLNRPDTHEDRGTLVNSPMRMRRDRHIKPDAWLASHLFRAFAGLHRLET